MRKVLGSILSLLVLTMIAYSPAHAANPYSTAYAVNDTTISHYDIDQRMKLLRVLGAPSSGLRDAAIEQLIDDSIKIRAARTAGFGIGAEGLTHGLNTLAASQNTTPARMWSNAKSRGVSRQAYDAFYTSQFAWRELVQRRFREAADPTSIEVDNAINVAAAVTHETILLAEIAIPFAERGEAATIAFANRLSRDLNNGASFEDVARRVSRSATATNGGVIGWVAPERLPAAIAAQVIALSVGQVSAPVRVPTGVILLKLIDSRITTSGLQRNVSVSYALLDFTGIDDGVRKAQRLQRGGLDECSQGSSNAVDFGPASGLFASTSINQVPADIALTLARLMPGKSEIMTNGNTVFLIQLCNRTTDIPENVQTQLSNNIFGQKLSKLAEGYLLELRRAAVIEKR